MISSCLLMMMVTIWRVEKQEGDGGEMLTFKNDYGDDY